jgi:hypothetical protein
MVDRDMTPRLRLLFGALIAAALLMLPALSLAGTDATAAIDDAMEMTALVDVGVTRPTIATRLTRLFALPLAMAAAVSIIVAGIPVQRTARSRRRLDDVGDDWRSLLLGAPPVRA